MNLFQVKELLQTNSIPFEECEFENEAEFLKHILSNPYAKNTKTSKFYALIIYSQNGKRHIELEFEEKDGDFVFWDLWFGEFCLEYFNCNISADDLLDEIRQMMMGTRGVIIKNNAKNNRWIADAQFDLDDDDDDLFGKRGFEKNVKKIRKKKSFIEKLLGISHIYEIYDWNTYECIVK